MTSLTNTDSNTDPNIAEAESIPDYAKLPRRLMAMLYDGLLVVAILMCGSAVGIGLRVLFYGADAASEDQFAAAHGPLLQLWLVFLVVGFFVLFWRWNGQTLGMQAWRLKVRNSDGSKLSITQCIIRLLTGILSWACLGAGFWIILFSKKRQSWTDKLSNSECVLLPKNR